VAKGNPKNIRGIEDLKRPDITFINRQKGSGTRVLLDYKLKTLGISNRDIRGYNEELDTHLQVAMNILNGHADAGMGIQSAAYSCDLEFIPATKEKFDLVFPLKYLHTPIFTLLLDIIKNEEFKKVVDEMGGYDTSLIGEIAYRQ
jgi:putative molybdopterin biosynthesis protein